MNAQQAFSAYDWHIRILVAWVQAFIAHEEYPKAFNLPDLERAKIAWRAANDFNVQTMAALEAEWSKEQP